MNQDQWLPALPVYIEGDIKTFPMRLYNQLVQYCTKNRSMNIPCSAQLWLHSGTQERRLFKIFGGKISEWRISGTSQTINIGRFRYEETRQLIVVEHANFNSGRPCLIQYYPGFVAPGKVTRTLWKVWDPNHNLDLPMTVDRLTGTPEAMRFSKAPAESRIMIADSVIDSVDDSAMSTSQRSPLTPSLAEFHTISNHSYDSSHSLDNNYSERHRSRPDSSMSFVVTLKVPRLSELFAEGTKQMHTSPTRSIRSLEPRLSSVSEHEKKPPSEGSFALGAASIAKSVAQNLTDATQPIHVMKHHSAPVCQIQSSPVPSANPLSRISQHTCAADITTNNIGSISGTSGTPDQALPAHITGEINTSSVNTITSIDFIFKDSIDGQVLRRRTYAKFNTVHMLYVQAVAAGIAHPNTTILFVQVAELQPKGVVREDDDDFDRVKKMIEEVKDIRHGEGRGGEVIEVVVVPYFWSDV